MQAAVSVDDAVTLALSGELRGNGDGVGPGVARRMKRAIATRPSEQWSMDFVYDAPFDGRRTRVPTLVDNHTREALAIVVDSSMRGEHVVKTVETVAARRGITSLIRVDHGPEFASKVLGPPGLRTWRNAGLQPPRGSQLTMQIINGRLQDECLDTHWFLSLEDARAKIDAWRRDYNASRPHSAPGHLMPQKFAAKAARKGCL